MYRQWPVRFFIPALPSLGFSVLECSSFGDVAQLGERRVRNAKVGSSILLVSTKTHAQPFSVGRFVLVEPRMVPHSRHCACATVSGPLHQVPAVRPSFSLFLPLFLKK